MENADGKVIYVGKSRALKNRVTSYFHGAHNIKTDKMVSNVADFRYITCDTEMEALTLEKLAGAEWVEFKEFSVDKDLKFTIKPNYTRSERTATIEVSNDDLGASSKQKIELKQEAYVFEADNNAVELEAAKDSSKSVSFTSSGSKGLTFEVYPTNSDWLKVENEDNELVITTLKENDATDNSATITVTDVESGLDVVIEVTQKAKAK